MTKCRWCGTIRHPDDHAGCSRCGNAWPVHTPATCGHETCILVVDPRYVAKGTVLIRSCRVTVGGVKASDGALAPRTWVRS